MAAALVTGQHAVAHSAVGVTSLSASLPGAVTPGNSVHVCCNDFNHAQGATEVADNQGNGTYAQDATQNHATGACVSLYSKQNVAASGTFTVTQTYGATVASGVVFVAEASGVATASAKDVSNQSDPTPAGNPATWSGPASGALSQTGDLVIAASAPVGNVNPSNVAITTGGYTAIDSEQDGTQYVVAIWGYQVVAGTGSQTVAYSDGENSTLLGTCPAVIVAYKAAPGVASAPALLIRIPNARVGPMALRRKFRRAVWPNPSASTQTFPQVLTATPVAVTATIQKQVAKNETATAVAVTASMQRQANKTLAGTAVAVTASMQRQVGKALTATTVAVTASLLALKVIVKAMTATPVAVTASLQALKVIVKAMTATAVAVTASMQRQVSKGMTASAVVVTASVAKLVTKKITATTVAVTASMQRQANKTLSAPAVVATGSMVRQVTKTLTAPVTASASMTKTVAKRLTATPVVSTASMIATYLAGGIVTFVTGFFDSGKPGGGDDSGPSTSTLYDSGEPGGGTGSGPGVAGSYDPKEPGQQ